VSTVTNNEAVVLTSNPLTMSKVRDKLIHR